MGIWQRSLRVRLSASFLLLSLVIIGFGATIAYRQARLALEQSLFEQLAVVASLKEAEISRWLSEQRLLVETLADASAVRRQGAMLIDGNTAVYESLAIFFNDTVSNNPNVQELFILANDGQVIFSTKPLHVGESYLVAPYFTQGQTDTTIQPIYKSPKTFEEIITVATPLLDGPAKEPIGVLGAHFNLQAITNILQMQTGIGAKGQTYLLLADETSFGKRVEGMDNVHSLRIEQPISNYPATIVVEVPQAEAIAPARNLTITLLLTTVAVALILVVGIDWLSRRLIHPITTITETAVRVADGHLDQSIDIMRQDELGVLANAFNTMQQSLRQSRQELEAYTHTLEQRVKARTSELQKANTILVRRAMLLETNNQLSQHLTSILHTDQLLQLVVDLIQVRFDYYFVGIWLLTDHGEAIVLHARAGRAEQALPLNYRVSTNTKSLIRWVCQHGRSRLVNDVNQDPDYLWVKPLGNVQSELVLPLKIGDETIGALDIQSTTLDTFTSDEKVMLRTWAGEIAVAIRNAQLYEVEQNRRQLAEALEETGRMLSSNLNMRAVPRQILNQLNSVVPYGRGSVLLQRGATLHIIARRGFPDQDDLIIPYRKQEDDVYYRIVQSRQPIVLDDVTQDTGWQQIEELPIHHSWIGVPLINQEQVIGMLSLTRPEMAAFTANDTTVVTAFAAQAAIALRNAALYDEITNFNEQLERRVQERTEELNQTYQALERLDKSKTDFISVTSHELRTPLSLIMGYAMMLAEDIENGRVANAQIVIQNILRGGERLQDIVEKMLDVAKLDTLTTETYSDTVSLQEVIEAIYYIYENALKERNLHFTMRGFNGLSFIQADSTLLVKAFRHLVGNAIKYTPNGGHITVSANPFTDDDGSWVEIIISDTGIGIDPEDHELIFEKFYQTGEISLHSSGETKFKGGGPGVGLAIVKGIIWAHNGRVWVESQGHDEERCPGSQFHIILPV